MGSAAWEKNGNWQRKPEKWPKKINYFFFHHLIVHDSLIVHSFDTEKLTLKNSSASPWNPKYSEWGDLLAPFANSFSLVIPFSQESEHANSSESAIRGYPNRLSGSAIQVGYPTRRVCYRRVVDGYQSQLSESAIRVGYLSRLSQSAIRVRGMQRAGPSGCCPCCAAARASSCFLQLLLAAPSCSS